MACVYWVFWHSVKINNLRELLMPSMSSAARANAKGRNKASGSGRASVTGNYSPENPYSGDLPALSFWQQFTDSLGFTNHAGQMQWQQEQNARAWESEYQLSLQDREYYSEEATAERMRAAGMNPDLLGVSAGQVETANNSANGREPLDFQQGSFGQFLQTLGGALTSAMSIYSGITSINQGIFEKDLNVFNSMEDSHKNFITDYIAGRLDDSDLDVLSTNPRRIFDVLMSKSPTSGSAFDLKSILINHATEGIRNKRVRKYAEHRLMSYFGSNSFQNSVLDALASRSDTRVSSAERRARTSALETLAGDKDDIGDVLKGVARISYQTLQKQTESDYYATDNQLDYNRDFSGSSAAAAANSTNRRSTFENQNAVNSQQGVSQIYKFLADESRRGNTFASALLVMLSIGRSIVPSVAPAAVGGVAGAVAKGIK